MAKCQDIDECKDWADNAAALASYAKQAEDETPMRMAARIKARATRRAGELLHQIQPQQGSDRKSDHGAGDHPLISRQSAARGAGMSALQQKQAIRIASVPIADFERQVESPTPPTLPHLAQQGIKPLPLLDLKDRDHPGPGPHVRAARNETARAFLTPWPQRLEAPHVLAGFWHFPPDPVNFAGRTHKTPQAQPARSRGQE